MRRARLAEPSCNRHLTERNHRRKYELHRLKLDSMNSSINNSPPKRHPHLNPLIIRKARDRKNERKIKRENEMLLGKMADILSHDTLDNRNQSRKFKKSVFHRKRLKEMIRITDQNQRLLSRLRSVKPTLSLKKMETDHKRNRKLVSNISLYGTNPTSPKQRVLTLSPNRLSSSKLMRPVTAPMQLSNRLSVKRTLFYTDTRVFGELVWDLNVWDVSGGVAMKKANHGLLKITGSSTTTPHKCSNSLDLATLRDIFQDESPLVYKALTSDGASNKPIAAALGGPSSLLTMQLGLHLISGLKIVVKESTRKKKGPPNSREGVRSYRMDLSAMTEKKLFGSEKKKK